MPLIYIDDGYPESLEYTTNYYWVESDRLEEVLESLGGRRARIILLPPDQEHVARQAPLPLQSMRPEQN